MAHGYAYKNQNQHQNSRRYWLFAIVQDAVDHIVVVHAPVDSAEDDEDAAIEHWQPDVKQSVRYSN